MLLSIALLAASLQTGDGALALEHCRSTYGVLGPERPDNRVLPGDELTICFEIVGAQVAADDKVHYTIGMEVTDRQGIVRFRQAPRASAVKQAIGRQPLLAAATVHVGMDQPAGEYTVKVTVRDRTAQAAAEFSRTYEVLPRDFGLVQLVVSGDPDAPAPMTDFQVGRTGQINVTAVGFGRDESDSRSNLRVVMTVTDADGRTALAEPSVGEIKQSVTAQVLHLPMQFQLDLPRAGRFTVKLTAEDRVTGKTAVLSLPLNVVPPR